MAAPAFHKHIDTSRITKSVPIELKPENYEIIERHLEIRYKGFLDILANNILLKVTTPRDLRISAIDEVLEAAESLNKAISSLRLALLAPCFSSLDMQMPKRIQLAVNMARIQQDVYRRSRVLAEIKTDHIKLVQERLKTTIPTWYSSSLKIISMIDQFIELTEKRIKDKSLTIYLSMPLIAENLSILKLIEQETKSFDKKLTECTDIKAKYKKLIGHVKVRITRARIRLLAIQEQGPPEIDFASEFTDYQSD